VCTKRQPNESLANLENGSVSVPFAQFGAEQKYRIFAEFRARPADFGALVTDLSMPRMPGMDFAREALTVRPDITAAITCGYARPEDNAQARLLRVGDIMLKPTTVDQMAITLDQLLQKRAAAGTSKGPKGSRISNWVATANHLPA
jgi:DNA-binding NtrC family response regulator